MVFPESGKRSGACVILFVAVLIGRIRYSEANDFPSLLVANATIGVILDHEFLDNEYEGTLVKVKEIFERILREDMREGGLIVKYYSWTQINFNRDFTAILVVTNCKNTWATFNNARKETLLLIALTDADCPRLPLREAITIPILTLGQELPQVLLDIRSSKSINWKTATVLHDDIFDRDTISRVANALSSEAPNSDTMAMTISLLKLNVTVDASERRSNIKRSLMGFQRKFTGSNYMVIATVPTTIIEVATELGMIETTSQWLFLLSNPNSPTYNISGITSYIKEGGNVAIAINRTMTENCSVGRECHLNEVVRTFVLALSKMIREEEAIYGQISDEEWEAIRLTKQERRSRMLEYMRTHLKEAPMCKPCAKWDFETAETWGLRYEAVGKTGKLKPFKPLMTTAGTWEPTNGLTTQDAVFPHIAQGFRNRTMPIATFHNPPWQIINYSETGEVLEMKGIVMHILNELADKLNFTYAIHNLEKSSNSSAYSYMDDFNVTNDDEIKSTLNIPTDILELMNENMVLFGAAAVTVTENFEKVVNFTFPISVQAYSMLISRPKELSRLYLFAAPFTIDTWLCLSAVIAMIGPLLYAFNFISPYNDYYHVVKKGGLFKFGNCFWYIYGALLQQGGMYLPKSDSGRLIVGTWWMVVLVVVTTYCGNLVAFLTFPKMEKPIDTVWQLIAKQNSYSWGYKGNTYMEKYLQETDLPKYMKLNASGIIHPQATNDVIDMVRAGKHVYIDWKTNLQHIMKRQFLRNDRCDFSLSTEEFLDEKISLMLPKNSPYLTIINKEIYRMSQMGFIHKWLTEYLPKKDRCSAGFKAGEIENHTVNLTDMQGCFLVLIAGVTASIIIWLCECICKKRSNCIRKKK